MVIFVAVMGGSYRDCAELVCLGALVAINGDRSESVGQVPDGADNGDKSWEYIHRFYTGDLLDVELILFSSAFWLI